uniref:Gustatory receptor n=1 Tax=Lutzomyia longipalpis TaxID=7200 RepID=A0A3F2ZDI3_LUTLO
MSIIPLNYFFMIAMNFVLQTPIQNLLAKIARCDQLMWKIGIQIDYRYHYRSIIAYLIATAFHTLMLILFMTFFLLEYNFPTISLKGVVIYLSATFAYTTFTGQMLLTLVAIKVRFRLINKHFEKHFLNRKNSVEEISDTSGLICKISTAHDHLNDIVCQTNICYSFQVSFDYSQSREELLMILWYFQILMMMLAWIVYTIHGIYDFYRIVFLYRANNQIFGYIGIIWISYYTTYLSGIVVMSSLVKREGMKTAILVHQAINLQRNQKNIEKIMMNMISWFIYTIYGTFNFYRLILINFKGYELLGYANMMWIVYHAMYLSAVVIFSSLIKAEGKKTSILLHQAINLEWNSKIVREMRIFSQQLGHRQPIVTCGLFPFDWSLFYSSIGLCVTYLTIMIQLDSSYSNPQLNVTLPAT